MVVDGKAIAAKLLADTRVRVEALASFGVPTLAIITCDPNFETRKYLSLKQRKAAEAGVSVMVYELPVDTTTEVVVSTVAAATTVAQGVVVQLPLPPQQDREAVLAAVPVSHDPDGFQYGVHEQACLSPVVIAIEEIARSYGLSFFGKRVVVIGAGRLVGQPAAHYARMQGGEVVVLTKGSENFFSELARADVVISGAGQPGLVTPPMVSEGVVIFDAGTSEDGGVLRGDVDPAVATKAALFTPVPGGIGPVTVAALIRNTVTLAEPSWQNSV